MAPLPLSLILMSIVSPLQATASSTSTALCPYLLGYARLDQTAQGVKAAGLFADDGKKSNLCGPCALVAVMGKIRASRGNPVFDPVAELVSIMTGSLGGTGTDADTIRNGGILGYELAAVARDHLVRERVSAVVTVHGTEIDHDTATSLHHHSRRTPILPGDLSTGPSAYVLMNYEGWRAEELDAHPPMASEGGWLNGHIVVLIAFHGPDGLGYYTGTILDPYRDQVSTVVLKPHDSKHLGIQTFEIFSGSRTHLSGDLRGTRTSLVTNVVRIQLIE
jgi:hypothetical protein